MYSMKEACAKVNLPYETLKFYCNRGLVPNVKRDHNNHRIFDDRDINWILGLTCLKRCGMTIQEMQEYLQLCLAGEKSIPERKVILEEKKVALLKSLAEINECLDYIDWKQNFYDDVLSGKTKYYSNLIQVDE